MKIMDFINKLYEVPVEYHRPKLRLTFLDGDIKEVTPKYYHKGRERRWTNYVDDGILLDIYPLTAIKSVEILEEETQTVIAYCDWFEVPYFATAEQIDKKFYKRGKFRA